MTPKPTRSAFLLASLAVLTLVFVPAASAQSSTPSFTKSFSPSTIGPGSISTLVFTITNSSGSVVTDLAFTDTLPGAVVVATPAQATTDCSGRSAATVSATEGGSTVSLADGTVAASSSCTVSVNVTSSTAGTHTNVSGDLTSSAGNSGSATADLAVATDRPGFSKSFSPSSVIFQGRSTLTFTLDNTANSAAMGSLAFSDSLPGGMAVADPANAGTTCDNSAVTATAGSSTISFGATAFGQQQVAAGASCTVSVDVIGGSVGSLENLSGDLSGFNLSSFQSKTSGKAGATLTVTVDRLALSKSFADDPVTAGSNVTLEFTLTYLSRSGTATDIAFTDDLDAVLSGLAAVSLPSDPCGSGSTLSGTSVLSLSGGTLAAGDSCTFSVTLAVPSGAAAGSYGNTTSAVSGNDGATPLSGEPASDTLFVQATGVTLAKSFTDDPVGAGGTATLELTLDNQSGSQATGIAFTDQLDVILSNATLPASGFCGNDATASFVPAGNFAPAQITISDASLAAGDSCTFQVTLDVAVSAPSGLYPNVTSEVTATIGGETVTSDPASDDLEVVGGARLSKAFTDDPVAPGDTVTLELTLEHFDTASAAATDITFTDDLDAVLSGLASISPTQNDVCGAGSSISGTSTLLFTGGTLQPGETCTFGVTLSVPASAAFGSHANTTSLVESTVSGVTATHGAAQDDLVIAGLTLSKEFLGDPALPGASVTLRFTIDNTSAVSATDIFFTDDLDDVLSGLAATGGTQNDVCGTGSSISDGGFLVFQGGSLAAGTSCTFDVPVAVPTSAEAGDYLNVASDFSADFGGGVVSLPDALDTLEVVTTFLLLEKEFVDDPVTAGDNVTLRFDITNLSATDAVADVAFTDDLDAALSGLASISGTQSGVCGSGSSISGTSLLSFTGGSLAAGGSCSFDVVLSVPTGVSSHTEIVNTTSEITGTLGGLPVDGAPAADGLEISALAFSKAFGGSVPAGGTVTLTFSIENLTGDTLGGIELTDDLSAVLSGLVATDTPKSDVCGSGSTISGSSFLTLTGGNLLGGGSCSITVNLAVPVSAAPGEYLNVSSHLRQDGAIAADPARATLTVIEVQDSDGDGVLDTTDVCPATAIPESVPTVRLGTNRFALVDGDGIFDTTPPPGGGRGPQAEFTVDDTRGCSCEQIIDLLGLGKGHEKFGCSLGAMREWVALVSLLSQGSGSASDSGSSSF